MREIGRVCFMMAIVGTRILFPAFFFFIVIIAMAMAPLCCLLSSKSMHLALNTPAFVGMFSGLWSAVLYSMCILVYNRNGIFMYNFEDFRFFLMDARLLTLQEISGSLFDAVFKGPPSQKSCMQSALFLSTQTTSILLSLYATRHMCLCASRQTAENDSRSLSFCV